MRIDHTKYAAMHPKSIAATDVLFNGAAAASAVGIPIGNAQDVRLQFHLGTVSASQSGIALSVYTSSQTSNVSNAALIKQIDDAIMALEKTDASKIHEGHIKVANIVPVTGQEDQPQYLYVKLATETADAVLCSCVVDLDDTMTQPVDPVEGARAFVFDV